MKTLNFSIKNFTPEMKKLAYQLLEYDDEYGVLGEFLLYNDYVSHRKIISIYESDRDYDNHLPNSLDRLSAAKDAYLLEEDCILLMPEDSIIKLLTKLIKREKIRCEQEKKDEQELKIGQAIRLLKSNHYKIESSTTKPTKKTKRSK